MSQTIITTPTVRTAHQPRDVRSRYKGRRIGRLPGQQGRPRRRAMGSRAAKRKQARRTAVPDVWAATERDRSAFACLRILALIALAMLVLCAAFSHRPAADEPSASPSHHVVISAAITSGTTAAPAQCVGGGCADSSSAVAALCGLALLAMWFWSHRYPRPLSIGAVMRWKRRQFHPPAGLPSRKPSLHTLCISRT